MAPCILHVGRKEMFHADSPAGRFSAFFEDDGETGYFYAFDQQRGPENPIVDAVHIYDVANVTDAHRPSKLSIVWSADGDKCALLINNFPHAAFDFTARRGYCRTNFPNFRDSEIWIRSDHSWSEKAIEWLRVDYAS
jgi:hypothetical protein